MTQHRATLCLFALVSLAGCAGGPTPSSSSPLSTDDLCSAASELLGTEVTVAGPFASDVVTPNGGSVAHCEPGTCCNVTYYAPTILCAGGDRVDVVLDPALFARVEYAATRYAMICRAGSDDLRPSGACPVPDHCDEVFGAVPTLTGHLEMRTSLFDDAERLTFVVTTAEPAAI